MLTTLEIPLPRLDPGQPGPTPPARAQLMVLIGAEPRLVDLFTSDVSLGRGAHSVFPLAERTVSGEHVSISWDGTGFMIEDLGSRNGTRVRGATLTPNRPRRLRHGDTIELGRARVVFLDLGQRSDRTLGQLRYDADKVSDEVDALLRDLVPADAPRRSKPAHVRRATTRFPGTGRCERRRALP